MLSSPDTPPLLQSLLKQCGNRFTFVLQPGILFQDSILVLPFGSPHKIISLNVQSEKSPTCFLQKFSQVNV